MNLEPEKFAMYNWAMGCGFKETGSLSETINPFQIYVQFNQKAHLKKLEAELNRLGDVKSVFLKIGGYGFLTTANSSETDRILSLPKSSYGSAMLQHHAKLSVCFNKLTRIGHKDYKPVIVEDFEYEAETASEPSLHSLNDDVLLNILEFLDCSQLFKMQRVCKRLSYLSQVAFCQKMKKYLISDYNILERLEKVGLETVDSHLKALMILGTNVKNVVLPSYKPGTTPYNLQLKRLKQRLENVLCEYCTGLEKLAVEEPWNVEKIFLRNPTIKEISLTMFDSDSQDNIFLSALKMLPALEKVDLCLTRTLTEPIWDPTVKSPSCQQLNLARSSINLDQTKKILTHLPNLKKLGLCSCGTPTQKDLEEILDSYENLDTVAISMFPLESTLKVYPSIQVLFLYWAQVYRGFTEKFPNLEELGLSLPDPPVLPQIDLCPNLKKLSLYFENVFLISEHFSSFISLCLKCPHLEHLNLSHLDVKQLTELIKRLPNLKSIETRLDDEDQYLDFLGEITEVTKKRSHKLKLRLIDMEMELDDDAQIKYETSNIIIEDAFERSVPPFSSYEFQRHFNEDFYASWGEDNNVYDDDPLIFLDNEYFDSDGDLDVDFFDNVFDFEYGSDVSDFNDLDPFF